MKHPEGVVMDMVSIYMRREELDKAEALASEMSEYGIQLKGVLKNSLQNYKRRSNAETE